MSTPTAPVFVVSARRWIFPFSLRSSILPASLSVLSEALDPHSALADLPKRPPGTANRQCALACHATARALAHIATVAASGPRQHAPPRSVRSAGASPASLGSGRTRLLMLAPARACRTVSPGAVTLMTEGARPSLPPPSYSHAVGEERSRPPRRFQSALRSDAQSQLLNIGRARTTLEEK